MTPTHTQSIALGVAEGAGVVEEPFDDDVVSDDIVQFGFAASTHESASSKITNAPIPATGWPLHKNGVVTLSNELLLLLSELHPLFVVTGVTPAFGDKHDGG